MRTHRLILPALLAVISHSARGAPALEQLPFLTSRIKVTAEPIWSLCETDQPQTMHPTSVTVIPESPQVGQDLQVIVDGTNDKRLDSGKVKIDVRAGFIRIRHEVDLCSTLGDVSNTKCPLEVGQQHIDVKTHIPREIPPFPIKGQVHIYDQDDALVTCIQLDFKLQPAL